MNDQSDGDTRVIPEMAVRTRSLYGWTDRIVWLLRITKRKVKGGLERNRADLTQTSQARAAAASTKIRPINTRGFGVLRKICQARKLIQYPPPQRVCRPEIYDWIENQKS